MILKKKEIIAASLVVLIGLAGYLHWSYQDTVKVKDNESYVQTGKVLGEAEMVSADNTAVKDSAKTDGKEGDKTDEKAEKTDNTAGIENTAYFTDAKANRENARAAAMEALKAASEDSASDDATRQLAGEKLVQCAENIELESNAENIAASKGFSEVCVYINEGSATVTVKSDGLSDDDVLKLTDAINQAANIPVANIKIIEVK